MKASNSVPIQPKNVTKGFIIVDNVHKHYDMGEVKVLALNSIKLSINRGEIVSIVGSSGSGKTTLLNIIGALDYVDSGKIIIDGHDLSSLTDKQLSYMRRETIGYVFQNFNLLEELTAAKNIEMPMILTKKPKSERKEKVEELLKIVNLDDRADHKPNQLSGGEQQRVAIARALGNDVKIILADEPTGNLDSATGNRIIDLLLRVSKKGNKTLIFVTHENHIAAKADRQIVMNDGLIIEDNICCSGCGKKVNKSLKFCPSCSATFDE